MQRAGGISLALFAVLAVAAVVYLVVAGSHQPSDRARNGVARGASDRSVQLPAGADTKNTESTPTSKDATTSNANANAPTTTPDDEVTPSSRFSTTAATHATPNGTPALELTEDEIRAKILAGEPGFEVLASRLPERTEPVTPQWEAGDTFIVETYRLQMQATPETWTGPALWRFTIVREITFRDVPCYEFVVSRADGAEFPAATYYVTRGDHRLAGMETYVTQQGKTVRVTHIPDANDATEAIEAPITIVPFDLPPIGVAARVAPAGLALTTPGPEERGTDRMPKADALVGAPGPYMDVTYRSPVDGTEVRQRWSARDMRWPVVSRTATTLSFRRAD